MSDSIFSNTEAEGRRELVQHGDLSSLAGGKQPSTGCDLYYHVRSISPVMTDPTTCPSRICPFCELLAFPAAVASTIFLIAMDNRQLSMKSTSQAGS